MAIGAMVARPMLLVEFVADRETKTPLTAAQVVGIVRYAAAHG